MEDLFKKALDKAGYEGEPTEELVRECFLDYVDCGKWWNLELEDAENMTVLEMASILVRL